jgi:hypothetical protein
MVLLIAGTLHQVSYMVALLFQSTAGVPGAVAFNPFEPVIAALYLTATIAMLIAAGPRHMRSPRAGAPMPKSTLHRRRCHDRVQGTTYFERPIGVFDFLTDPCNEPRCNPLILARKQSPTSSV